MEKNAKTHFQVYKKVNWLLGNMYSQPCTLKQDKLSKYKAKLCLFALSHGC